MDIFEFRNKLVADYAEFSTSFTRIAAADLRAEVDREYAGQRYWPAPLIQLNANYRRGKTVQALAREGLLHAGCGDVFRVGKDPASGTAGTELALYQHQEQAIALALQKRSFVVTTGTGSGKSLTFFIPIVDRVLKVRAAEGKRRTRAIVIYPMNALANSQMEELRKFLNGYSASDGPIVVERYTGQEDESKRQQVADNPPDILLTNFMMLELLLTRYEETDRRVIDNCQGLEFLVLDELHTYRGRQGADVALLVRRLRQRLKASDLICVGTSATMSSVGSEADKRVVVSQVASRLFGVAIGASEVVTETLERSTDPALDLSKVRPLLKPAVAAGIPAAETLDAFRAHPVAVWIELALGIEYPEGPTKPTRARPMTLDQAAETFAEDAGIPREEASRYLTAFLLASTRVRDDTGRGVFAFRLHQFISGAGKVWTSLEEPGKRAITLEGQRFVPGRKEQGHLLYAAHFCRECGQEYHPVWDNNRNARRFDPREIDDTTAQSDDVSFGFLMSDPFSEIWKGDDSDLPDTWLDFAYDPPRIKQSYKRAVPQEVRVEPSGNVGSGMRCWYLPGKFRFCLRCGDVHETYGRDQNRLASLSGEGRSSATTMIALAALRQLFARQAPGAGEPDPRKLLGFSDNRQDAALQAGHFNDFVFLLTLRAGVLRALQLAPGQELGEDEIGEAVFKALGFDRDDPAARAEYLRSPRLIGLALRDAQTVQRALLAHRVLYDLRRGWRYNNPNLEQLQLLAIDYAYVDEFAADESLFSNPPPTVLSLGARGRAALTRFVLRFLRESLCIESRYFDVAEIERLRNRSYQDLKEPWGFSPDEEPFTGRYLITSKRPSGRGFANLIGGGSRSRLVRRLRQEKFWSDFGLAAQIKTAPEADLVRLVDAVLSAAKRYGLVESTTITEGVVGWRLRASGLRWRLVAGPEEGSALPGSVNTFFRALYRNIAVMLGESAHALFDFESHEHTAQVEGAKRQMLEARFRFTPSDRERWREEHPEEPELQRLPVMFCSPTMELGVDISALNHVYLRNVPPTPANYAQRSGRAGRSGQPALVITYCAAQSPHDQYFFRNQAAMVHGEVRAPTLDLANPDLVESHMNAVWLASAEIALESSVAPMLDLDQSDKPLLDPWRSRFVESGVTAKSVAAVHEVLAQLKDELTPERAPRYSDRFADEVVAQAAARFNAALDRWRGLYDATDSQMTLADRVLRSHAVSPAERDQAQRRYNDAARQRKTLLRPGTSLNSDFYTYRYLASQGFLPGYNFPRLPLLAWIPARGGRDPGDDQGTMIARPRFLALGEFGPRSLIYHEGRIYRVVRALLQVSADQVGDGTTLPTISARVCGVCGYGHLNPDQGSEPKADVCEGCGATLTDDGRISSLYRIENVATLPAERITVNDEERRRQGYEMQTTYRYGEEQGVLQREETSVTDAAGTIATLQYGPAATVWRVNRGWRRRKNRNQLGFMINPMTGWWSREDSPDEDDATPEEATPSAVTSQRIVPYVEDRRNVLIVRPGKPLSLAAVATLQIALKRGIEQAFQIEESELIAEPLPDSKQRNAILLYEAAEGGAGVLTRLATDPQALAESARAALRLMHFSDPSAGQRWEVATLDTLEQTEAGQRICEAGCYRCLLTYFNQPDHELIARRDPAVLEVLVGLANGTTQPPTKPVATGARESATPLAQRWLERARSLGARLPDAAGVSVNGEQRADFRYDQARTLIFLAPPDAALAAWLYDRDWSAIFFGPDDTQWPAQFAAYAAVFGLAGGVAS